MHQSTNRPTDRPTDLEGGCKAQVEALRGVGAQLLHGFVGAGIDGDLRQITGAGIWVRCANQTSCVVVLPPVLPPHVAAPAHLDVGPPVLQRLHSRPAHVAEQQASERLVIIAHSLITGKINNKDARTAETSRWHLQHPTDRPPDPLRTHQRTRSPPPPPSAKG